MVKFYLSIVIPIYFHDISRLYKYIYCAVWCLCEWILNNISKIHIINIVIFMWNYTIFVLLAMFVVLFLVYTLNKDKCANTWFNEYENRFVYAYQRIQLNLIQIKMKKQIVSQCSWVLELVSLCCFLFDFTVAFWYAISHYLFIWCHCALRIIIETVLYVVYKIAYKYRKAFKTIGFHMILFIKFRITWSWQIQY